MKKLFIASTVSLILAGCASNPDNMGASYVSTAAYQGHSCEQLASETQHLERRRDALHGELKKLHNNDTAQMAAGLLLLWPMLFFLEGGDGPQASEYTHVKGQLEAVRQQSVTNRCGYMVAQSEDTSAR